jgi:uncharacterized protein
MNSVNAANVGFKPHEEAKYMIRTTVREQFLAAVKARDTKRADALRSIEVALKDYEIDNRTEVTDEIAINILRRELKKRDEAIVLYKQGNRQDLVDKESYEAEMIKNYLPAQMDREAIAQIIDTIIAGIGENTAFSQVMPKVMQELKGKADGKLVSEIVKEKTS